MKIYVLTPLTSCNEMFTIPRGVPDFPVTGNRLFEKGVICVPPTNYGKGYRSRSTETKYDEYSIFIFFHKVGSGNL